MEPIPLDQILAHDEFLDSSYDDKEKILNGAFKSYEPLVVTDEEREAHWRTKNGLLGQFGVERLNTSVALTLPEDAQEERDMKFAKDYFTDYHNQTAGLTRDPIRGIKPALFDILTEDQVGQLTDDIRIGKDIPLLLPSQRERVVEAFNSQNELDRTEDGNPIRAAITETGLDPETAFQMTSENEHLEGVKPNLITKRDPTIEKMGDQVFKSIAKLNSLTRTEDTTKWFSPFSQKTNEENLFTMRRKKDANNNVWQIKIAGRPADESPLEIEADDELDIFAPGDEGVKNRAILEENVKAKLRQHYDLFSDERDSMGGMFAPSENTQREVAKFTFGVDDPSTWDETKSIFMRGLSLAPATIAGTLTPATAIEAHVGTIRSLEDDAGNGPLSNMMKFWSHEAEVMRRKAPRSVEDMSKMGNGWEWDASIIADKTANFVTTIGQVAATGGFGGAVLLGAQAAEQDFAETYRQGLDNNLDDATATKIASTKASVTGPVVGAVMGLSGHAIINNKMQIGALKTLIAKGITAQSKKPVQNFLGNYVAAVPGNVGLNVAMGDVMRFSDALLRDIADDAISNPELDAFRNVMGGEAMANFKKNFWGTGHRGDDVAFGVMGSLVSGFRDPGGRAVLSDKTNPEIRHHYNPIYQAMKDGDGSWVVWAKPVERTAQRSAAKPETLGSDKGGIQKGEKFWESVQHRFPTEEAALQFSKELSAYDAATEVLTVKKDDGTIGFRDDVTPEQREQYQALSEIVNFRANSAKGHPTEWTSEIGISTHDSVSQAIEAAQELANKLVLNKTSTLTEQRDQLTEQLFNEYLEKHKDSEGTWDQKRAKFLENHAKEYPQIPNPKFLERQAELQNAIDQSPEGTRERQDAVDALARHMDWGKAKNQRKKGSDKGVEAVADAWIASQKNQVRALYAGKVAAQVDQVFGVRQLAGSQEAFEQAIGEGGNLGTTVKPGAPPALAGALNQRFRIEKRTIANADGSERTVYEVRFQQPADPSTPRVRTSSENPLEVEYRELQQKMAENGGVFAEFADLNRWAELKWQRQAHPETFAPIQGSKGKAEASAEAIQQGQFLSKAEADAQAAQKVVADLEAHLAQKTKVQAGAPDPALEAGLLSQGEARDAGVTKRPSNANEEAKIIAEEAAENAKMQADLAAAKAELDAKLKAVEDLKTGKETMVAGNFGGEKSAAEAAERLGVKDEPLTKLRQDELLANSLTRTPSAAELIEGRDEGTRPTTQEVEAAISELDAEITRVKGLSPNEQAYLAPILRGMRDDVVKSRNPKNQADPIVEVVAQSTEPSKAAAAALAGKGVKGAAAKAKKAAAAPTIKKRAQAVSKKAARATKPKPTPPKGKPITPKPTEKPAAKPPVTPEAKPEAKPASKPPVTVQTPELAEGEKIFWSRDEATGQHRKAIWKNGKFDRWFDGDVKESEKPESAKKPRREEEQPPEEPKVTLAEGEKLVRVPQGDGSFKWNVMKQGKLVREVQEAPQAQPKAGPEVLETLSDGTDKLAVGDDVVFADKDATPEDIASIAQSTEPAAKELNIKPTKAKGRLNKKGSTVFFTDLADLAVSALKSGRDFAMYMADVAKQFGGKFTEAAKDVWRSVNRAYGEEVAKIEPDQPTATPDKAPIDSSDVLDQFPALKQRIQSSPEHQARVSNVLRQDASWNRNGNLTPEAMNELRQLTDKDQLNFFQRVTRPIWKTLEDIHPEIGASLLNYEHFGLQLNKDLGERLAGFKKALGKLNKDEKFMFSWMAANRDVAALNEFMADKPALRDGWEDWKEVRELVAKVAKENGLEMGHIEDYFVRTVKDYNGLHDFNARNGLSSPIQDAIKKAERRKGVPITDQVELARIANSVMEKSFQSRSKGGSTKARKIEIISKEQMKFYETDPLVNVENYVHRMVRDISNERYFGVDAATAARSTIVDPHIALHPESTIGGVMVRLLREGKITPNGERLAKKLIAERLNYRPSHWIVQGFTGGNVMFALHNIINATTQLQGLAITAYRDGFYHAMRGAKISTGKALQKPLTLDNMGVTKASQLLHGHEGVLSKWNEFIWKYGGFRLLDAFEGNVSLNSYLSKLQHMSKAAREAEIEPVRRFLNDGDVSKVAEQIRKGEWQDHDVKFIALRALSGVRPTSLSSMPSSWLRHPEARIAYNLKVYATHQLDLLWNEGAKRFEKGDHLGALKHWAFLGGGLVLSGATIEEAQDFMLGKEVSFGNHVWGNALKLGVMSKYQTEAATEGRLEDVITSFVSTPLIGFLAQTVKDANKISDNTSAGLPWYEDFKDSRIFEMVPTLGLGKVYHWRFSEGNVDRQMKYFRAAYSDQLTEATDRYNLLERMGAEKRKRAGAAIEAEYKKLGKFNAIKEDAEKLMKDAIEDGDNAAASAISEHINQAFRNEQSWGKEAYFYNKQLYILKRKNKKEGK